MGFMVGEGGGYPCPAFDDDLKVGLILHRGHVGKWSFQSQYDLTFD